MNHQQDIIDKQAAELEALREELKAAERVLEKCRDTANAINDARHNSILFTEGVTRIRKDANSFLLRHTDFATWIKGE